jgi:hypothetical protein
MAFNLDVITSLETNNKIKTKLNLTQYVTSLPEEILLDGA